MMGTRKDAPNRWRGSGFWIVAAMAILFYAVIILVRPGEAGYTSDERLDVSITTCYAQTGDWAACPEDLSQTRLPYYIHAAAERAFPEALPTVHYYISFAFGLATLLLLVWFTRKELGEPTALILALLLVTSFPFLTSSRMLLTNANILFTCFTALTLIASYYANRTPTLRNFAMVGIALGLAISTNILGIFLVVFLGLHYLFARTQFRDAHLVAIPLAVIAFLATSPFYLVEGRLFELAMHLLFFEWDPLWWNYFGFGHNPPWWYSFLLFAVKLTPWFALAFFTAPYFLKPTREKNRHISVFLFSIFSFILLFLLVKPTAFNYDAPHHHVHVYVWAYVIIAYVLTRWYAQLKSARVRIAGIWLFSGLLLLQLYHLFQFFPFVSLYGAQYGEQFIGDIYGPGVFAFQKLNVVDEQLNRILEEGNRIFFLNGNIYHRQTGVLFGQWDGETPVRYAFDTFYYGHHIGPFDVEAYRAFLQERCEKIWNYELPYNIEAYAIYECKTSEDN